MKLSVANRMITAELFSDIGNQFIGLTLMAILFFEQSGSLENLLFLCLIQQMPAIVLGPMAGRLIDGIGPKQALLGGMLAKIVCVGGLYLSGARLPTWGLYLLFMIASLLFYISRLSITPLLIAKDRLINYNAINERVALAAGIAGPFLIGLLIRHTGSRWALLLGASMFLCSMLWVLGLPSTDHRPSARETSDTFNGLQRLYRAYIAPLRDRRVKIWFGLLGVIITTGGLLNFGAPVFNKIFFQGDIAAWGGFMSAYQAGACLAAFLLPTLAARMTDRRLVASSFVALALAFGMLAAFQWLPLFAMMMMVFGCGSTLVTLFLESRIQRDCTRDRLGRTMAALSAFRAAGLLCGILAGVIIVKFSGIKLFMALGAGALVVATMQTRTMTRSRNN